MPDELDEPYRSVLRDPEPVLPRDDDAPDGPSRRAFLAATAAAGAIATLPLPAARGDAPSTQPAGAPAAEPELMPIKLSVNGKEHDLKVDTRASLLDTLRETLHLTGTKKGCDHGQCGACTVHVDGRRVLSCLTLACQADGQKVTSIEGLADGDKLHPIQEAFIKHDGFQCGYCTPGQICSAVALLEEIKRGDASHVTEDVSKKVELLTDDEIRERMSGNLCRCGAYPNIVAAIAEVARGEQRAQTWRFVGGEELAAVRATIDPKNA
jgi:xanthine dehydrogenase YagT iron-sulfur-binding subunit